MRNRARAITRASLVAIAGNALLAAAKITVGLLSGSLAVVGDGIDSSTDVVISFITLAASRLTAKPSDREHPFGHGRVETIATSILAFVIFFAGAQLILSTVHTLIENAPRELPEPASLYVTVFSVLGKLLLAWSQFAVGRKYKSDMLVANGKNMRNDVLISSAVLLGLFFTFILKLPILDPIVALLVGLWILKVAVGIFFEVNTELMDGNTDSDLYRVIFEGVRSVPGAGNPHRARIRKIANLYDVDLDIEVDPALTVAAAHNIAVAVENAVRCRIDNIYDVMVHVEPEGNLEEDEVYGLSEDEVGCEDTGGK
jgi:cation diffusion facilitator family transporter